MPSTDSHEPSASISAKRLGEIAADRLDTLEGYGLKVAEVDLTSAEIKTLNSAPIEILPAVEGRIYIPVAGALAHVFGTSAYAVTGDIGIAATSGGSLLHGFYNSVLAETADSVDGLQVDNSVVHAIVGTGVFLRAASADPTTGDGTGKFVFLYVQVDV